MDTKTPKFYHVILAYIQKKEVFVLKKSGKQGHPSQHHCFIIYQLTDYIINYRSLSHKYAIMQMFHLAFIGSDSARGNILTPEVVVSGTFMSDAITKWPRNCYTEILEPLN